MYHLSSSQMEKQEGSDGSYRLIATAKNFPVLKGMSFYRLNLNPMGAREPHWHANADELGYCTRGKVLVSFYKTGNIKANFLVEQGEMFFIPSGTLHAIENVDSGVSEMVLQFSHEAPEDFPLSSTFGMFSDQVLANTWGVKKDTFQNFHRSLDEVFTTKLTKIPSISENARYNSPYRFNLEGQSPAVSNEGGSVKFARQNTWPILRQQALYSLLLTNQGMREPHWHPETAEMGYVTEGKARMSILSPNKNLTTYEISAGDIYFIPKGYPHHIENLMGGPLRILVFFDQAIPGDIGFTASVKSFDSALLTSVFHCQEDFFPNLPTYYYDRLIVQTVAEL